jgi:hypothetical protein
VAPVVVEYVPTAQSVHTALPVAILYLPAMHAVQEPPSGPVNPTLHVQAARAELEIGELELVGHARQAVAIVAPVVVKYVPAAQSLHTALPMAILYFPATQAVHTPPSVRMKTLAPLREFKILICGAPEYEASAYNILLAGSLSPTVIQGSGGSVDL